VIANKTTFTMAEFKGPAMTHFKQVKDMTLEPVTDNANASLTTIVHSKHMQAGVFELNPGPAFPHSATTMEAMVLVLSGQFLVNHIDGERYTLNVGDHMHVRVGTKLEYTTEKENSRLYFAVQTAQSDDAERVQAGLDLNPAPIIICNLPQVGDLPPLPNDSQANAYLKDIIMTATPGKELTGGLYKIFQGPAHDYVYDYEEFKYIVSGQLNLTDGTGQYVEAKAGDLMYFPDGTNVNFATGDNGDQGFGGLGFFVGQRVGGSA